jgi:hypothetical protein
MTLLQFADDTPIVTTAHPTNLKLIMTTLDTFAKASGLEINLAKSGFLPIAILLKLMPTLSAILQCSTISLPTQYLGLPLTIKKPPKMAYLPMLIAVQQRYEGYKGKHLSMASRTILTNSILNAISLHHMQALLLLKWVTNRIKNITRRFLWTGTAFWHGRKLPCQRLMGGLNIMDIELQNKTLLKWERTKEKRKVKSEAIY